MSVTAASEPPVGPDRVVERLLALDARLCLRQILGARIGLYAGELLDLEPPRPDKRLLAIVETDVCFLEGVAEVTGCRAGCRTMRVMDHRKAQAPPQSHGERPAWAGSPAP